ncbi:MAG: sugar phosphate isomerase/epimerase, partial [Planctomycetes bacterium]|nr:sugar phosphate isomerase/epimerase [Planctomycetota bacterium]
MKLGVMMALFGGVKLDDALDRVTALKLEAVEIGAGNYPGSSHCPVRELIKSKAKARDWAARVRDRGLEISALACHGNPLHPSAAFARKHHDAWRNAVKL